MYKNLEAVLKDADQKEICVGAFNMHTLDMLPAMIRGAKSVTDSVIIQTSVGIAESIGYELIVGVCEILADLEDIDVVLHLDHAKDFNDIKNAIDAGFSSVMYDGSLLPLTENIKNTQKVVEYAHPRNVSVEAELGAIGGTEDGESIDLSEKVYTDVEDAIKFVKETNVDALAVAIGTTHGQFKSKTKLNFDLLEELHNNVKIPLVVHGGTGVKETDISRLKENGIRKFNVGTELLVGWTSKAKEMFAQTKVNESLRNNIMPCNKVVFDVVASKSKLFSEEK